MDYQRINKLLDKYWECATSVEEERELRQFFSSAVVPPDLLPYKAWFVSHEASEMTFQPCKVVSEISEASFTHIEQKKETKNGTVKSTKIP